MAKYSSPSSVILHSDKSRFCKDVRLTKCPSPTSVIKLQPCKLRVCNLNNFNLDNNWVNSSLVIFLTCITKLLRINFSFENDKTPVNTFLLETTISFNEIICWLVFNS